jgi:sugar O-acyltransferase (sialic acid O-acetyltransferase NeuD family)
MKDAIIIGSGGHGAELDEYIIYSQHKTGKKDIRVIGFLDDNPDAYAAYTLSAPLLGGVRDHQVRNDVSYIMGIGNLLYRKKFVEQYLAAGANFLSLIHADAYISPSAKLGMGVIIAPYANVGPNVEIGNFTLLNSRCSMGHDTKVGAYNFISPNVCFSGMTSIGDSNLFGINSATIPCIKVGNRNKIMAGMVLDKNVGDDEVVFYRFKEKVLAIPKD